MEYPKKTINESFSDPFYAIREIAQNTLEKLKAEREETPGDILDKAHDALRETLDLARRVIQTIDQLRLLKTAKKSSDEFKANSHEAVKRALDIMNEEGALSGITVLKILPRDLMPAPVKPEHLEAVISQTLSYFKFRLEGIRKYGTGMISIEAGEKHSISPENPNLKSFVLRISNNGPEIDQKELPDLFDPICSSAPNGLGIYLCRKIADYYSGTLRVETGSQSTVFQYEFPV